MKEKNRKKNRTWTMLMLFALVVHQLGRDFLQIPCVNPVGSQAEMTRLVGNIVNAAGGLPKEPLNAVDILNGTEPIYPIQDWHVGDVRAKPYMDFDFEPEKTVVFDVHVTYADGDNMVFKSGGKQYGYVFCPFNPNDGFIAPLGFWFDG